MRNRRLLATFAISGILALAALLNPSPLSSQEPMGASYVTTIKDANGSFASRGVITLHADHTISVTDSGQGGPAFFFGSQLGSWRFSGPGEVAARTIDFDYPPAIDTARLDYSIKFAREGNQISGTVTLTTFPLEANPQGSGGTVVGTFPFTGQLIQP